MCYRLFRHGGFVYSSLFSGYEEWMITGCDAGEFLMNSRRHNSRRARAAAKNREMARKILLVEDDPAVLSSVRRRLVFEGFEVDTAETGAAALERYRDSPPDLLIVDVMLPELDGFQVVERVRAQSDVPILMLTARDAVQDRVTGLERGADDYLVKPFDLQELLARIRALLRRAVTMAPSEPEETAVLEYEDLCLNPLTREVSRGRVELQLTPREFSLLEYMMRHPRQVLTRESIFESVWGYDHDGSSNVIDVYIRQLREKMEHQGKSRLIQTVRGVGYALREE